MHGAVWTGTEMLIWGGNSRPPPTTLGDGARYDPALDRWLPLPQSQQTPSPRRLFGSAWTGSEWLIWGGNTAQGGAVNTGARFDPIANTWSPITDTNSPSPHYGIRLVWTGSLAVFWGGGLPNGTASSEGGRYDPVTDSWSPTASWLPGGAAHAVEWSGSEYLVLDWTGTAGRYDPASDTWRSMSLVGAPAERQNPFTVWTGSEMIVWGGSGVGSVGYGTGARYDPITDVWTPMSDVGAPSPRGAGAATWTGCRMIVWGGAATGQIFDDGAEYDPATDAWTPLPSENAPTARGRYSVVWTGRQAIFWGGANMNGTTLGDGARYVVD